MNPAPTAIAAVLGAAAVGGADGSAYPGPAPWDGAAWAGAALYLALFAAAVAGVLGLVRQGER